MLGEDLSRADADRLSEDARREGVPTRVVPSERLVVPPPPVAVNGGGLVDEGLRFTLGAPARERLVPLDRLRAIALLPLREESRTSVTVKEGPSAGQRAAKITLLLATGIPVDFGGKPKEVTKEVRSAELTLLADFITSEERFRVDAAHFAFGAAEGKPKVWSGLENLRRLLADVRSRLPRIPFNRGARWVVENRPLTSAGYAERTHFEREIRWLLTLSSTVK